jgi:ABC-type lipoprotein export system ATPase subunit
MPEPSYSAVVGSVDKTYRNGTSEVPALRDVSIRVPAGRIVALFGPSGSGKSTLLRMLAAVDRPDRGSVEVAGVDITDASARRRRAIRRREVAYVLQDPGHNLVPYLDAIGQLRLALTLRGRRPGSWDPGELLDLLGLGHRRHHHPIQLSGGEQQRLAVCAAVVGAPAIVLFDEPTAELDTASAATLLASVTDLRDRGTTFVISSHDEAVRAIADEVVELHHGRLAG